MSSIKFTGFVCIQTSSYVTYELVLASIRYIIYGRAVYLTTVQGFTEDTGVTKPPVLVGPRPVGSRGGGMVHLPHYSDQTLVPKTRLPHAVASFALPSWILVLNYHTPISDVVDA